jgi:hypothetical protein
MKQVYIEMNGDLMHPGYTNKIKKAAEFSEHK